MLYNKIGMDYGNMDPMYTREERIRYINFKLAASGLPIVPYSKDCRSSGDEETCFLDLFQGILEDYKEKTRLTDVANIGIYKRINDFFQSYFTGIDDPPKVIDTALNMDHYGLARELSLPAEGEKYSNEYLSSFRISQGVLHNPKEDRRTTEGSFHIVEGGPPVPYDKKAVPVEVFANLYRAAVSPPEELTILPFTSQNTAEAKTFVSLMLKPIVSPLVQGVQEEKTMEILFVAPGSFVANLDFVESVFGNGGDPVLHTNDSGLDVDSWSGHTGYIVLAPHLNRLRKKDLGLPHYKGATERQRRDRMCYEDENELYNDGNGFKITCRDTSGVVVTLIADNYFGYSKKEIKTQIGFAANLFGNAEEEHAGGTIAYPQTNMGFFYNAMEDSSLEGYTWQQTAARYGNIMDIQQEGYGIDKRYPQIIYLPEKIKVDLNKSEIRWVHRDERRRLHLLPGHWYVLPNGEKFHLEKHPEAPLWKLVGTAAEGTFCHKPCTVSGGGKSEISKSINNSIIYGTYYVWDLKEDLDHVERILQYDFRRRFKENPHRSKPSRSILSEDRTLGSVIKLLTPQSVYSEEFNEFLASIPNHVKALVFMIKRFYRQAWGDDWRRHFTVDIIDGKPGNELKIDGRRIRPSYLRVGFQNDEAWRTFKLRMDFMPSEKIQMEDDITASVLIPRNRLPHLNPDYRNSSLKFAVNCEYRFFQRPDEAIHKGYDKKAEKDLSEPNLFVTNFEPLTKPDVEEIKNDVNGYITYSEPVRKHIDAFLAGKDSYCIVSSEPRIIDGEPSKNPRYLEHRSDFVEPIRTYLAEVGERFARRIPLGEPVLTPVNAILPGRRNNPPGEEKGKKIPPLAVYNPIHYQELPELFMDFIASLSGKSPSTTGAGSEGALTKGPFNMLLPVYDLNSALLSCVMGDYHAYTTPAGHIGPRMQVDHDISMLLPELWARLRESERDPRKLIREGSLEKLSDFQYNGEMIPASRLGYRITDAFCCQYLGKMFDEPQSIFTEEILKPELQDMEAFAEGIKNIAEGHRKAALHYFMDGSIEQAIPPIKALLSVMAYGNFEGNDLSSDEVRGLFRKDYIQDSEWYRERLLRKQQIDVDLLKKKIHNLEAFLAEPLNRSAIKDSDYPDRLEKAKNMLNHCQAKGYLEELKGMTGA